jgi:hypothetical protein
MSGQSTPSGAAREPEDPILDSVNEKSAKSQKNERDDDVKAITPLELVTLPTEKRRLLLWLSRQKEASLDEILNGVAHEGEDADLEDTLNDLLSSGHVKEIEVEGESHYRCQVRGQSGRKVSGMREDIWSRIDAQDSDKSDRK